MGKCLKVFTGHSDEVLDICFNSTGTKLATASADSTCKIYSVAEAECIMTLEGTAAPIQATTRTCRKLCSTHQAPRY